MRQFLRYLIFLVGPPVIVIMGLIFYGYHSIQSSPHAGLFRKHYRNFLHQVQERKQRAEKHVILIGCSNLALPDTLAAKVAHPVINLALYRNIGLEVYSELLEEIHRDGDVVLISIAYGGPTFSMDGAVYRTVNNMLAFNNVAACIPFFAQAGWNQLTAEHNDQLSSKSSLSFSYGNESNIDDRNIFRGHFDIPNRHSEDLSLSNQYVRASYDPHDVQLLNKLCKEKKAIVAHPSVADNFLLIDETAGISFVTKQADYIFPASLMFDNRFHLNWEGRMIRTARLARDLNSALHGSREINRLVPVNK